MIVKGLEVGFPWFEGGLRLTSTFAYYTRWMIDEGWIIAKLWAMMEKEGRSRVVVRWLMGQRMMAARRE